MLLNLKIVRKHIQIINQSIVLYIHISNILRYNLVSRYQHLTSVDEGLTLSLTYKPVNELTHISD